jgi:hypothetical protein
MSSTVERVRARRITYSPKSSGETRGLWAKYRKDGFIALGAALSPMLVRQLRASCRRALRVGSTRLMHLASVRRAASELEPLATLVLGGAARAVNAVTMNKTRSSNWGLDWHRDRRITVKGPARPSDFSEWSVEYKLMHVTPPLRVLESSCVVMVHLDASRTESGAIRLIRGSHRHPLGEISDAWTAETCELQQGGVLLMSPLLAHKSPYSRSGRHRRTLQFLFTRALLPAGLSWSSY